MAEMLRAATLAGIGIAALPTWGVAQQLRSGRLRRHAHRLGGSGEHNLRHLSG